MRFFHGACAAIFDRLTPQLRIQILANIDIIAADNFFVARGFKDPRKRMGEQKLRELLIDSTRKLLVPLGLDNDELCGATGRPEWIRFDKTPAVPNCDDHDNVPAVAQGSAPTVIKFDEISGKQLNQQLEFAAAASSVQISKKPDIKLPWREWRSGIGSSVGELEADKAAAVAVLHGIHANFALDIQPIEVWGIRDQSANYVTATCKTGPRGIMLPPCVPKQSKVLERSEHPWAVEIITEVRQPADHDHPVTDEGDDPITLRKRSLFVNPEFKGCTPSWPQSRSQSWHPKGPNAAELAAVADEWIWGPPGEQTMHPFWAVRRMTDTQLAREVHEFNQAKAGCVTVQKVCPRFNCVMEAQVLSCVSSGVMGSQLVGTTRLHDVPCLTNSITVEEGEELFLEVKLKTKEKRWKKGRGNTRSMTKKRRWTNRRRQKRTNRRRKKRPKPRQKSRHPLCCEL